MFDLDKLVTRIDTEPAQFFWITKQTCQEELGRLSNEQFLDFCLLLGSPFLRSLPLFENPAYPGKSPTIRDALPMFNAAGRNALTLCAQFEEDRRMQELHYADLYKRAYMIVKHHVYIDVEGRVGPMDPENTSSDMHELIGQRLPEELYFYLSKGIIGADVPNFLTTGEVRISLPLGTEDTEIYRRLVGEILTPIRTQSICLLANSLHRFYQTKVIRIRPWFDENSDRTINLKGIPSVKETIHSWKIHGDELPESIKKLQAPRGSFKFAVQSLSDSDFASKSFANKETPVSLPIDLTLPITNSFDRHFHHRRISYLMLCGASYNSVGTLTTSTSSLRGVSVWCRHYQLLILRTTSRNLYSLRLR